MLYMSRKCYLIDNDLLMYLQRVIKYSRYGVDFDLRSIRSRDVHLNTYYRISTL